MPIAKLQAVAEQEIPKIQGVAGTWAGLIIFAIGKWGVGVVGFALLVPVYMDMKASNERIVAQGEANNDRYIKQSEATVLALTNIATAVASDDAEDRMTQDAIRRIEAFLSSRSSTNKIDQ